MRKSILMYGRSVASVGAGCLMMSLMSGHAVGQPTSNQLQDEIRKRDAIIDSLLKRVDALEKEFHSANGVPPAQSRRAVTQTTPAAPPRVAPLVPGNAPVPTAPPVASAAPPSEEAAEDAMIVRALENTLVDQGGLLLSPYVVQFVPDFSYSHQSINQLSFVFADAIPGVAGGPFTQRSHRDLLEWGFGFRLGLPWESQVSIRIPVGLDYGAATFGGGADINSTRGGIGDISFLLQKQILHEKGLVPDVLLSVGYAANTGSTNLSTPAVSNFPFAVGTGSGFNALSGGITLLKRQDPLVFLGGFTYTHSFASTIAGTSQTVGDAFGYRIAVILAASPDTSLRIGWNTTFQQDGTFAGKTVPGSNQQISFMEFGVGSNLSRNLFMDASLEIGLTRDTPDFVAQISFPFRF